MNRHRLEIQPRFGDTDALGHVNNAAYAAYAELGRLGFLQEQLGRSVGSIILASLHLEYRRQVNWTDRIHIETWVAKLGGSSIALEQEIFANGERAADVRSVVVYFDYAAGQSRPLPNDLRAQLEPFVAMRAEGDGGG